MTLIARAFTKVNVGLEVLRKREDGYHELRTILQTIDFYDELHFRPSDDRTLALTTNDRTLPIGAGNLVHRAASMMAHKAPGRRGVAIHLQKNVPSGMGLGGGSADAAITLLALDRMWRLDTSAEELHGMASSLGMDVPFFLHGGTALAVGRGDEVYPLDLELDWPIVLILPDFAISTADAYASLALTKRQPSLTLQHFVWRSPCVRGKMGELVNHLEAAAGEHTSSIQKYRKMLLDRGAQGSMMSGSGSAVFGVFQDETSAQSAMSSLSQEGIHAVATRMLTGKAYRKKWLSSGDSRA